MSQLYLTIDGGTSWTSQLPGKHDASALRPSLNFGPPVNPVVYQAVLRPGNVVGLIKDHGVADGCSDDNQRGIPGLNSIGTFATMFPWHSVFAVDPNNPQHLIAADAGARKMMVSTTGGTTWGPDDPLTNLVTNFGQFDFAIIRWKAQACFTHATNIAFDPSNWNRILVGTHQAGIFVIKWRCHVGYVPLGSNLVPHVSSFFFDEVQNDVIASSYGRGLWKLDPSANRPPVASDQSVITNQKSPVAITLIATDPDGDPITYSVVTNPSHGQSLNTFNPSAGTVIYAPITSYFGPDSFTFKATDNRGADNNTATVSITVEGPPDRNNPTSYRRRMVMMQETAL